MKKNSRVIRKDYSKLDDIDNLDAYKSFQYYGLLIKRVEQELTLKDMKNSLNFLMRPKNIEKQFILFLQK